MATGWSQSIPEEGSGSTVHQKGTLKGKKYWQNRANKIPGNAKGSGTAREALTSKTRQIFITESDQHLHPEGLI